MCRSRGGAPRAGRGWKSSGAGLAAGLWLAAGALAAPAELPSPPCGSQVVGGSRDYEVQPGDSLTAVGARFGEDLGALAAANGLTPVARLRIGQVLRIENLHIVPAVTDTPRADGILINLPQRMLFQFRDGAVVEAHPVGLGRPTWRTPVGEFKVGARETDKTWYVPLSIQEEMRREGLPVKTQVPPGPENPLGRHWLGLAHTSCGIHGTIAPASIYRFQTHGCIRLHPDDMATVFERSRVGEPVRIVYAPLLAAVLPDGAVLLEVHKDVYGRAEPARDAWQRVALACGLRDRVDPARVEAAIAAAEGLARDVRPAP